MIDNSASKSQAAEAALVAKCPAMLQRRIRFVNTGTDDANLFITCPGGS